MKQNYFGGFLPINSKQTWQYWGRKKGKESCGDFVFYVLTLQKQKKKQKKNLRQTQRQRDCYISWQFIRWWGSFARLGYNIGTYCLHNGSIQTVNSLSKRRHCQWRWTVGWFFMWGVLCDQGFFSGVTLLTVYTDWNFKGGTARFRWSMFSLLFITSIGI